MELAEYAEFLVKSIVKNPDMIKVKTFGKDDENILEILVSENEMGVVIGRQGKMANALRTMILAFAYIKGINNVKINIDSF